MVGSMSSKRGKKKRETPSMVSAAGLIRFFEESELRISLKPHYIIIIAVIFVTLTVAFSKLFPPSV